MAEFDSDEERTESPSTYRREEFRRQGTVALSKELLSVAIMLALGLCLALTASLILKQFGVLTAKFFAWGPSFVLEKEELLDLRGPVATSLAWMVLPVFAVAILAGIAACAAQVGFYFSWEPLAPKWERMDPVQGFQRLFSMQGVVEAVKALFKLGVAGIVLWFFFKGQVTTVGQFLHKNVSEGTILVLSSIKKLFMILIASLSGVAILDYVYQRFALEKKMKMTKREAKEEFKLREGDPLIRQRIRNIQRKMASRRMMEAVPKADVIVTNPTHLAVALQYDVKSMSAPKVTAKGAGVIALKIREMAKEHRVPIVENKPLARTLFKEMEIGQYIPRELYKAVAEVLAYVYRLRNAARMAA